jgi:hypothetical protein
VAVAAMMTLVALESHRLEIEADNTAADVHAGLALQAERLKREGILRTTPEQVAAAAEPNDALPPTPP